MKARASLRVVLHHGHQREARLMAEALRIKPLVVTDPLPGSFRVGATRAASARKPAWWNAHWRYRAKVGLSGNPSAGWWISGDFDTSVFQAGRIDPESLRLVAHIATANAPERFAVIDTLTVEAEPAKPSSLALTWRLPPETVVPPGAQFMLYFDTEDRPKPKRPATAMGHFSRKLANGSFEKGAEAWSLENASVVEEEAPDGQRTLRLSLTGQGVSLAANNSMRLSPNSKYRLTFQARAKDVGIEVRTNFYQHPYDFTQVPLKIEADGRWHKYETVLETGDFPQNVAPALRIWLLNQNGTVFIDEVSLEPMTQEPGQPSFTVNPQFETLL